MAQRTREHQIWRTARDSQDVNKLNTTCRSNETHKFRLLFLTIFMTRRERHNKFSLKQLARYVCQTLLLSFVPGTSPGLAHAAQVGGRRKRRRTVNSATLGSRKKGHWWVGQIGDYLNFRCAETFKPILFADSNVEAPFAIPSAWGKAV